MGKHSKTRYIPISALGPRAQAQIAAMGPPPTNKRLPGAGLVPVGVPTEPVNKYGVSPTSERTASDGQVFDSKLEMNAYLRLQILGVQFTRQAEYVLQEGFERDGKKYRPIAYRGDFLIPVPGKLPLVVDTKGMQTEAFKIKWKLLMHRHQDIRPVQVKTIAELTQLLVENGLLRLKL